ncbi:Ig-like domain-containing protein [Clostridium sp. AUH-JLR23]|uniref:Ig-like domain-containing protein n=1 Tax=Clostridium sp. AUH-JLR23 TaxID=1505062 RepID=UPI0035652462
MTLIDSQGSGSIDGDWPIFVRNDATFTMNSGTINAKWYGVTGNGSSNLQGAEGTTININGGVINQNDPTDPHTAAIYHPQKGTINISGGRITGSVGIQLCSGGLTTVNINGGIVTGTGKDLYLEKPEADGCIGDGAAISALDRNYPGGAPYVTINGGTFISEQSQSILAYSISKDNGKYVRTEWANAKEHVSIAGGTFSSDVTTYVAEGYKTYLVDNNYKVVPETTGIELSDESINIAKGNAVTLTATLKPEGAIDEITWSSSDNTVATVDATGKVTAVAPGKATITVQAGNQTATCEVTVYEVESDVEAPIIDTSKPVDEVTVGINDEESQKNISDTLTSIVDDIANGKEVTSVNQETKENIKQAIDDGKVVSTEVQVKPVETSQVDVQDKKVIEDYIDEKTNIAQYIDISVVIKADNEVIGEVNELNKEVTFTVAIPEDLMKEGRTFYVIRVHDGKAEKLDTVENEDGTLTFKTDKFSTYALAYEDAQESITTPITPVQPAQPGQSQDDIKGETVVTPDNNQQVTNTQNTQETAKEPKTGDTSNIALYGAMALISLGLVGAIVLKKKVSEK